MAGKLEMPTEESINSRVVLWHKFFGHASSPHTAALTKKSMPLTIRNASKLLKLGRLSG